MTGLEYMSFAEPMQFHRGAQLRSNHSVPDIIYRLEVNSASSVLTNVIGKAELSAYNYLSHQMGSYFSHNHWNLISKRQENYASRNPGLDFTKFENLFNSISNMQEMSEWEDLHLDYSVGERAKKLLAIMRCYMRVKPPKIINDAGDDLIFTWKYGNYKFYLNVTECGIDLVILETSTKESVAYTVSDGNEISVEEILNFFDYSKQPEPKNELLKFFDYSNYALYTIDPMNCHLMHKSSGSIDELEKFDAR